MEFRDMELTILFYANENRILSTRLDSSYRYNHDLEERNKNLQEFIDGMVKSTGDVHDDAIETYKRTIADLRDTIADLNEKLDDLRAELASVQGVEAVVQVGEKGE